MGRGCDVERSAFAVREAARRPQGPSRPPAVRWPRTECQALRFQGRLRPAVAEERFDPLQERLAGRRALPGDDRRAGAGRIDGDVELAAAVAARHDPPLEVGGDRHGTAADRAFLSVQSGKSGDGTFPGSRSRRRRLVERGEHLGYRFFSWFRLPRKAERAVASKRRWRPVVFQDPETGPTFGALSIRTGTKENKGRSRLRRWAPGRLPRWRARRAPRRASRRLPKRGQQRGRPGRRTIRGKASKFRRPRDRRT